MGFLDRIKNSQYPWCYSTYLSGHPSVGKSNVKVTIVLYEDKIAVYNGQLILTRANENEENNEKYALFKMPYEKIVSTECQSEAN